MPDLKVITVDKEGNIQMGIPRFDDSVSGILSLAQTVALMLMDPNYGNLGSYLKKRIDNSDVGELVLRAVDNTERALCDEQSELQLEDSEILASIDVLSVDITKDELKISLFVKNELNENMTINI